MAGGEAGGITQHIGAYQVELKSGERITFVDTPGHEAFTAMRARGASVTDIVVLVVAADDGVMPQTIEAIRHAKAANAPIIVAINKMDKPDANPARVRQELLSHDIVVEEMGGETQDVEVSATKKTGLDKLEEAILLQAEILDLRANPDRTAEGSVIESRLDRGRGPVGTILVQRGTLHQGDIVVAGAEWGRVRAMLDDKGKQISEAGPSTPVEILGLSGAPVAGEPFVVVENEARAREITEFRQRRQRDKTAGLQAGARGTLDQMLARIQAGVQKEVAILIKADVQGSAEAIQATVMKLEHEEVKVRVLLSGVGQITESDVQLAKASSAVIIAFNVRATSQAREMATRDGVDIRYFSIIYEVADDVEKLVRGKVAPKAREQFLGYAEVRQVFNITKTGKVAGCYHHRGPRQARRRRAGAARQRGDPQRRVVATQALQGRCARGGARLRMRPVVRELPRSAGRRRRRVLRSGDGSGLKKARSETRGTEPRRATPAKQQSRPVPRRRSASCGWPRKSATCWRGFSRGGNSATRSSPRRISPSAKCGSART